jgi:hypothetical protein
MLLLSQLRCVLHSGEQYPQLLPLFLLLLLFWFYYKK